MSSAIQRFEDAATAAGLSLEIRRFPQGTKTAADAARAIGCQIGQIVKSLVFMARGRPFLALTSGSNRADQARLATLLGCDEVRRARPDEARVATGYAIGGTPPFGHSRRLMALVDRDLLSHEVLWAAAGTPDSVFPITPDELLRTTGGQVADFKDQG
ncbi:MAG TPA: YbaK/EbsC family protein [Actinomycetota bacterium]|jgi:prolyl-tRNA editing enzyme YbaK/EbsC (Cys-tRNA(Pro) deacylase)